MFKDFYNVNELIVLEDNDEFSILIDKFLAESVLSLGEYVIDEAFGKKYPCNFDIDDNKFYKLCGAKDYERKKNRQSTADRTKGVITDDEVKMLMRKLYPHLRKSIMRKDLIPDVMGKNRGQIRSIPEELGIAFAVDSQDNKLFLTVMSVVPRGEDYSALKGKTNVAWVEDENNKIKREKLTAVSTKGREAHFKKHNGKDY